MNDEVKPGEGRLMAMNLFGEVNFEDCARC